MRDSEQMAFFNASSFSDDASIHRSHLRSRVKTQTKRRHNAVNAGTVPATRNTGKQWRPVAAFRGMTV